jgi:hypothetical protein
MVEHRDKLLDDLVDEAVEELLLTSDDEIIGRVHALTGSPDTVSGEFDRLIKPAFERTAVASPRLVEQKPARIRPAVASSRWSGWFTNLQIRQDFSRLLNFSWQSQFALASLLVLVIGVSAAVPQLVRNQGIELASNNGGRSRDEPKGSMRPRTFVIELASGKSVAAVTAALEGLVEKHPSIIQGDRSLFIRRNQSGSEDAFVGGVAKFETKTNAETFCLLIRAEGSACEIHEETDSE